MVSPSTSGSRKNFLNRITRVTLEDANWDDLETDGARTSGGSADAGPAETANGAEDPPMNGDASQSTEIDSAPTFRQRMEELILEYESLEAKVVSASPEENRKSDVGFGQSRSASCAFAGGEETAETSLQPSDACADASTGEAVVRQEFTSSSCRKDMITFRTMSSNAGNRSCYWENSNGGRRSWCGVIEPDGRLRLVLDTFLCVLGLYDAVVVPLNIAWGKKMFCVPWPAVVGLVAWTTDMAVKCNTCFYDKGRMVVDYQRIIVRYFMRGFAIDALIVGIDLANIVKDHLEQCGEDNYSYFRWTKILRLLRVYLLARRVHARIEWNRISNNLTIVSLAIGLVVFLFLMNNLLCCAWFWIGDSFGDTLHHTWLDMTPATSGHTYGDRDVIFQYTTALHWSFSQMTPGSMSVVPQNYAEGAFNIFCLVIGLFANALLISQLSAKIVRIQTLNQDRQQGVERLARFLKEKSVPIQLAHRIRHQVYERMNRVMPLTTQDLPHINVLTLNLKAELSYCIFAVHLLRHTVFYCWAVFDEELAKELSSTAMASKTFSNDDDVFVQLQEAKEVLYVVSGQLMYKAKVVVRKPLNRTEMGSIFVREESAGLAPTMVSDREWVSTIALWCRWNYLGNLTARTVAEFATINVEKSLSILKRYPSVEKMNSDYARTFAQIANEQAYSPDLDIDPYRVIWRIPREPNYLCQVSSAILQSIDRGEAHFVRKLAPLKNTRVSQTQKEFLRAEIDENKSVYTINSDLQFKRTVMLCLFNISHKDKTLYEVAKNQNGCWIPVCYYPGTKRRTCETVKVAIDRFFREDVPGLTGELAFDNQREEYEIKKSLKVGIETEYIKMIFNARVVNTNGKKNLSVGVESSETRSTERSDETGMTFRSGTEFPLDSCDVMQRSTKMYAWLKDEEAEGLRASLDTSHLAKYISRLATARMGGKPKNSAWAMLPSDPGTGCVTKALSEVVGKSISVSRALARVELSTVGPPSRIDSSSSIGSDGELGGYGSVCSDTESIGKSHKESGAECSQEGMLDSFSEPTFTKV